MLTGIRKGRARHELTWSDCSRVRETRKVTVQAFVSRNEFIGEGEARHETAFLEPEDGAKTATARTPPDCLQNLAFTAAG